MAPSIRTVLTSPVHLLAFGLGTGLAPRAPGTFGTLLGLPLWWLLSGLNPYAYLAITAALFVFGCWLCGESARRLGEHDVPGIVFDEVVGFLVTAIPLLPAFGPMNFPMWACLAAAFAVFRLFDIWKPWPIRRLDAEVGGGFGIMLDDLAAGLYGAAMLILGRYFL
jgi:phosphatidylglycerophosphatase A